MREICIQHCRRQDVADNIVNLRRSQIDPYRIGYDFDATKVDLSELRLCFQVVIRDRTTKAIVAVSEPAVTHVISNPQQSLIVTRISALACDAKGGAEIMVFTKKFSQRNIIAHFFEQGWSQKEKVTNHQSVRIKIELF